MHVTRRSAAAEAHCWRSAQNAAHVGMHATCGTHARRMACARGLHACMHACVCRTHARMGCLHACTHSVH
eukprot:249832-Chlamydomonas_euryale.AAC.4